MGLRATILLGVVVVVAGCASPSSETCGGEVCGDTQRCVGGTCRATCSTVMDCPRTQTCQGGVCIPAMTAVGASASSSARGPSSGSSSVTASAGSTVGSSATASSSAGTSSGGGGTSAPLSSSGPLDCTPLDTACFVGTAASSGGCQRSYRCPHGQVCVTPGNTCVPYPAPATPGTDPVAGECYILHPNARTFLVCNLLGSWLDARAWCQAFGGFDLAQVGDTSEHDALAARLSGGRGWLGLTDQAAEGAYAWSNGAAFTVGMPTTAPPWCSGAPDNAGGVEDCVEFVAGATLDCWDDTNCANTNRAVMCSR